MVGPIYRYEKYSSSTNAFPAFFDGHLVLYEWARGWVISAAYGENGQVMGLHEFLGKRKFKRPVDVEFGPDGSLYILEWGSNWFENKDARLVRIVYRSNE